MAKFNYDSRTSVNRQKKRRRQNILLSALVIILLILIIFLVLNFNKNKVAEPKKDNNISQIVNGETNSNENDDNANNSNTANNDDSDNSNKEVEKEDEKKENKDKKVKISEVETEDNNVEKAYIGNWEPVGTKQTGEHNTQFEEGSDDRNEIRKAIVEVTDINESDLIEYWIGNNGPDKVIATVSDMPQDNIFRVYLSWVDKEGWQVTKVERLKEYDQNNSDSVDIGEDEVTKIEKDSE